MSDKETRVETDTLKHLSFDDLIHQRRSQSDAYYDENLFSQTPLDIRLMTHGGPYKKTAPHHLGYIIDDVRQRTSLPELIIDQIWHEMLVEHERRCGGSEDALERLKDELTGKHLSVEDYALVEKALRGDASLADTGQLLLRFPSMQSLEAVKYTNPIDPVAENRVMRHVMMQLGEFGAATDLMVDIYGSEDPRKDLRFIDTTDSRAGNIVCTKENIAEISDGNALVQLVHKGSHILIPKDARVRGVESKVISLGNEEFNLQNVSHSFYWRVTDQIDRMFPRYK